jgi:hypothetical protein
MLRGAYTSRPMVNKGNIFENSPKFVVSVIALEI